MAPIFQETLGWFYGLRIGRNGNCEPGNIYLGKCSLVRPENLPELLFSFLPGGMDKSRCRIRFSKAFPFIQLSIEVNNCAF